MMTAKHRATIGDSTSAVRWLLISAFVVATPVAALAQTTSTNHPVNAVAKTFGNGWDCENGYRKSGDDCELVRPPANAALTGTSYGRGWECRRGYRESREEKCVAIEMPANAYLSASGARWECHRGFREADEICVAINVPPHGYLTESTYGSGWKCERGYRVTGESCDPIELPANAYLSYSGNDWDCERPYRKQQDACVLR